MKTVRQLLVLIFLVAPMVAAAGHGIDGYQYLSPMPGSIDNTRESTIIIREGHRLQVATVTSGVLEVVGSVSGRVVGDLVLSPDGRTIIFKPNRPFEAGERVEVAIRPGIVTDEGSPLPAARFDFQIGPFDLNPNPYELIPELRPNFKAPSARTAKTETDSLLPGFPPMQIEPFDSSAVGDGYIFLAVASEYEGVGYYLMMLNNDGTPFFARELEDDYAYDFKVQPNGQLSYAHFFEHHSYTGGGNVVHMIMDNSFTVIDSVQMGNGYIAEAHDFQILPNGHYLLFGYYLTPVDMSRYVEGGRPDALVSGGVVQELDADKNVIFQWRSWDYYSFDDWDFGRGATSAIVPEFHLNTINVDNDGHVFLATPSTTWKLNRQTGEIVWTLGGDRNEFTFLNVDPDDGPSMVTGHAFHRLENGNVLLYDNGNRPGTRSSRVNEFRLDEEAKTAELIWTWEPETVVAGWHRGSAQRLPNGNTVIGWGGSNGKPSPAMTEVNTAGDVVYELSFVPPDIESYRAFRFPFPDGAPAATVVVTEVAPGNTYDFAEGDSITTGVSIDLTSMSGSGYNELSVARYNFAPIQPQFQSSAPRVLPVRMVLDAFAITSLKAEVMFDIAEWNIRQPDQVLVYHREFEGQGLFVPLPTTYNAAKGVVVASADRIGEFILTIPDLVSAVYTPVAVSPADSGSVNQAVPVRLEWTPVGYVDGYDFQLASEEGFTELLVDQHRATDAFFVLDDPADDATYYWRVRSTNEAGTSDWTKAQMFTTTAAFIRLDQPSGGEELVAGLDYYIRWIDNIEEDVVIELHLHDALIDTIAITESDGAYEWEVEVDRAPGPGYWIKIFSSTDGSIVDSNAESFSIVTTTAAENDRPEGAAESFSLGQNFPNPIGSDKNWLTTITFQLPAAQHVRLTVYDVRGRRVATVTEGMRTAGKNQVVFDASILTGGVYLYKLETPSFSDTGRMVLMK